ncbi:MAG: signal recognition particle-docking protein FtsY [Chloroflexi bacterium]|nr:signal recognition particle-docking protein FtsY [Chloroflexota bacterium]
MTSSIEKGVDRTKRAWFGRVTNIFSRNSIPPETWDELEEALIGADVGLDLSEELISRTRDRVEKIRGAKPNDLRDALASELVDVAVNGASPASQQVPSSTLRVILVVGVNGSGKTTSIAKLARREMSENRRVLLVAGDTFRAAAIEQLQVWGERLGVPVIAQQHGADPGAVAFDGIAAAKSRGVDTVIIDTAGRLQTRTSLMDELRKVRRVVERTVDPSDITVLLVLDATTGQNGLSQAREFMGAVGVDGVILTKVDGTSKGGIAIAIRREFGVPVTYIGTGEGINDLEPFDANAFVTALLA